MEEEESNFKRKYKKRYVWSVDDETILIQIWREKKEEFKKHKKNYHIIKDIAKELMNFGIEVSEDEIKTKIHNTKNKYRSEIAKIQRSGGIPSDWLFFPEMDEILGPNKYIKAEGLQESPTFDLSPFDHHYSYDFDALTSTSSAPSVSSKQSIKLPKKRKKLSQVIKDEILREIKKSNKHTEQCLKKIEEMDKAQMENDATLIKLEQERNEILKKISEDNESFNNKLLDKL